MILNVIYVSSCSAGYTAVYMISKVILFSNFFLLFGLVLFNFNINT